MTNGETPPRPSGLSLTPQDEHSDGEQSPATKRSRTEELLANSSLSLVPVDADSTTTIEPAIVESATLDAALTQADDVLATETDESVAVDADGDADVSRLAVVTDSDLPVALSTEIEHVADNDTDALTAIDADATEVELALADEEPVLLDDEASTDTAATYNDELAETMAATDIVDVAKLAVEAAAAEPDDAYANEEPMPLDDEASADIADLEAEPQAHIAPLMPAPIADEQDAALSSDDEADTRRDAIAAAERDAAALFGGTPPAVAETPANDSVVLPVSTPTTQEMPAIAPALSPEPEAATAIAPAPESAADIALVTKPGKAIFEAKPLPPKEPLAELEIPPPPTKKIVLPTPAAEPEPAAEPKPEPKVAKPGLFGKIGEWKGHLNYLHSLYKEDPNTAVAHWKQSYKERTYLSNALNQLQERQHADNFSWDEIPRVLSQFHLRDDDRGQADWYGDAARQYQAVLAALEKQKAFKPPIVQPLMKELKFIAEADAFHQKYGLTTVQQKVKTMYMTLQHRIDEYMKMQKQQLEIAGKDKEIEKLRAQEAIATAEAQKIAQENRLVQEQRLKVVEDKKRLEVKRAAEDAERVRLERQREIEAEQAEHRRREELSASFRAIEQEELMRKAVQTMSLSQCAEGLLRQLFEKDSLTEQEKAAAARVLDVLKAKLG